jgi:uncharacterized protein YukE
MNDNELLIKLILEGGEEVRKGFQEVKTSFSSAVDQINAKSREIQQTFRSIERVTRPIGMALAGIGAAGLAFADDVKKWNKPLGEFLEELRPVFIVMTAFGGLLLTLPPIIKGAVTAFNVMKVVLVALQAQAIATQAAFGLLTLGISMIAAGIGMLVTHGRHVEEVTAETERWGETLGKTNDRLHDLITAGEGASEEAQNLRRVMDDLIKTYDVYNTIGEDNVVTTYNLADAEAKLAEAKGILSTLEDQLIGRQTAANRATEIGKQQTENLEASIGNYKNTIVELTLGILELKDAQDEETQALRDNADAIRDTSIKDLEQLYGLRANESISLMQQFEDETDARRESLDDQLDDVRKSTNDVIKEYQREYDARVKALDDETNAQVRALQEQLGLLDANNTYADQAAEDKADAKTEAGLRARLDKESSTYEWTREGRAKAEQDLAAFLEEVEKKKTDRSRELQRKSLQDQISTIQSQSQQVKTTWQEELDAKTDSENAKLAASEITIQAELDALDQAVIDKRIILQQELNDAVSVQNQIYNNAIKLINDEVAARIEAAAIIANIPTAVSSPVHEAMLAYLASHPAVSSGDEYAGGGVAGFAGGGDIIEPTALYGLKSQRVYAVAGEAGVEHVGPGSLENSRSGGGGNLTINVAELHVREEADVDKVAEALYRKKNRRGNYGA